MSRRIILFSIFIAICIGCSPTSDDSSRVENALNRKDVPYIKLDKRAQLYSFGTNILTKSDVDALVELRLAIQDANTKLEMKQDPRVIRNTILCGIVKTYRTQWALSSWMQDNSFTVDSQYVEQAKRNFARKVSHASINFENSIRHWPQTVRETARQRVNAEATASAADSMFIKLHPVSVASNEVDAALARLYDYNARASLTNALVWARATNIWQSIVKGAAFETVASKLTEDECKPERGEWAGFLIGDFDSEPEFQSKLKIMKAGEITPPLEVDNGISIVRLDSVENVTGKDGSEDKRYNLSRVFLRLPLKYEIPQWNEMRDVMVSVRQSEAIDKFHKSLESSAEEKYPCGRRCFESARRALKISKP